MLKNQRVGEQKKSIMRKVLYLSIFFFTVTLTSYGQYFIGGGLGLSTSSGKTEVGDLTTTKPSSLGLRIAPEAGFILSDKLWIGLDLSLGFSSINNHADPEIITQNTSFGLAPFARYYFFKTGKLSFYGQAQAGIGFMSQKVKTDNNTDNGLKTTQIGLNVFPGMAYNISDKCQLFTSITAFSLGINTSIRKDGDFKDVSTSAGLNIDTNNIFTTDALTVGAYFKF